MMADRTSINYIYFGIFFVLSAFLHIYHISLVENATFFQKFFYILYAIGQCLLEIGCLVIIQHILNRLFPKGMTTIFVVLTFLLFLVHVVDFPLIRIMGMTIWYVFDWIRAESLENFMELLYATHISMTSWLVAGLAAILLPITGILLFRFTHRMADKKPLYFSPSIVGFSMLSVTLFLSFFDFKICAITASPENGKLVQALPWKTTLFSTPYPKVNIGKLESRIGEASALTEIHEHALKVEKKPPIFLFIMESLRDDFLTKEVAPHLSHFRENHLSFRHSLAAANGTHLSWFSIFHSIYPFYWEDKNPKKWSSGSLPLQILKKAGYKIRVYSASRLRFYQMDERIFGRLLHLADNYRIFGEGEERENHEKDTACIDALLNDIETFQEGNVFVVFLESTHFGYSWPKEDTVCTAPPTLDYFNIACSNSPVEGVKNRYRNAIHFLDRLFGSFTAKLNTLPSGKNSIVVVTGDHGEEFFEEGRIFHTSNLNAMQTHVPIYYKIGEQKGQKELSSHLDIFPTIFDHIFGHHPYETWFDGESVLNPNRKNFVVSARYNASRTPYEFLIHNGKNQWIARFENRSNILASKAVEIISKQIEPPFQEALGILFKN